MHEGQQSLDVFADQSVTTPPGCGKHFCRHTKSLDKDHRHNELPCDGRLPAEGSANDRCSAGNHMIIFCIRAPHSAGYPDRRCLFQIRNAWASPSSSWPSSRRPYVWHFRPIVLVADGLPVLPLLSSAIVSRAPSVPADSDTIWVARTGDRDAQRQKLLPEVVENCRPRWPRFGGHRLGYSGRYRLLVRW